jgi:hypothetical protein
MLLSHPASAFRIGSVEALGTPPAIMSPQRSSAHLSLVEPSSSDPTEETFRVHEAGPDDTFGVHDVPPTTRVDDVDDEGLSPIQGTFHPGQLPRPWSRHGG